MKILGIETSCDETAAAIVQDGKKILSHVVASSQKLHLKTGGIIPEVAAREQIKYLLPVIEKVMENCQLKIENLDGIAVTVGPGLIGSLLVGVETAKTLAYAWQKPIVPVNHLVGHIYANWLNPKPYTLNPKPSFPAVALIASGGHTGLVLMKGHGKLRWLGGTRDDAAGEAFDKIARILGLGYPGGPAIAATAAESGIRNQESGIRLPRPMIDSEDFDFSFSGLKTAVLRQAQAFGSEDFDGEPFGSELRAELLSRTAQARRDKLSEDQKTAFASEVQEAITDVLAKKTIRAAEKYKVKTVLLSGGVAANQRLREKFKEQFSTVNYQLYLAPPALCTDNAAMIASAAFFNYKPLPWQKIQANPGLYF